jgi:imidazolonepropionase-like amidohydrolase
MLVIACADPPGAQPSPPASLPVRLLLTSPPGSVAITDVTVIDVVSGARHERVNVVVSGGRIAGVGRAVVVPPDAVRLDGAGKFLIPGLWDMHAHHEAVGVASLDLFVANGVVGTRDMGSAIDVILPLRDRINRGEVLGPEIVAAGPILDNAPADWPFRRRVTGATDAREAVRDLKQRGVDFVKVHDQTPRPAFFAIADEAARLGLPVSGHVPLDVTVEEAAKAGLKSEEHFANYRVLTECSGGPRYDVAGCKARFEALAASGMWHTPTLAILQALPDMFSGKPLPHAEYASDALIEMTELNRKASNIGEDGLRFLRSMRPYGLTAVRDLVAGGSRMLAGCDAIVPGFCLHDEMQLFVEAGLTPLQALQTATINVAHFLGREKEQGTAEVGRRADLVLLEADPLLDIRHTSRIAAVVVRGRPLSRANLDAILAAHRREPSTR